MGKIKKKFPLVAAIAVGLVPIALGVLLGAYLSINVIFKPKQPNYKEYREEDLVDNMEELLARYNSVKDEYTTSKYFEEYEPWDLANITLFKLSEKEEYYSIGKGNVNAEGINQSIRTCSIKKSGKHFLENISRSNLVKVARRFYQENNIVKMYKGRPNSIESANWEARNYESSIEDFKTTWGKTIANPFSYIISSLTCKYGSKSEQVGENFEITLYLDQELSVINTIKEMTQMSDLSDNPIFNEDTTIKMVVDNDFRLLSSTVIENYKVKKPIWMNCEATISVNYYYDNVTEIPNLETNCNYVEVTTNE